MTVRSDASGARTLIQRTTTVTPTCRKRDRNPLPLHPRCGTKLNTSLPRKPKKEGTRPWKSTSGSYSSADHRAEKERTWQTASGDRPRRGQRQQEVLRIVTGNVNCARRAQEEITHGSLFPTADIIMLQEHKARGEQRDRMEQWLRQRAWEVVSDDAYVKYS